MTITLLTPDEGDDEWRIEIGDGSRLLPMRTRIKLRTPTADVVKLLHCVYRGALIRTADDTVIHPKPPGGYPIIHHSQPTR